jgi:hypothetical protein
MPRPAFGRGPEPPPSHFISTIKFWKIHLILLSQPINLTHGKVTVTIFSVMESRQVHNSEIIIIKHFQNSLSPNFKMNLIFRCSSRSKVSDEHLMGRPCLSVCRAFPIKQITLMTQMIVGARCCKNANQVVAKQMLQQYEPMSVLKHIVATMYTGTLLACTVSNNDLGSHY